MTSIQFMQRSFLLFFALFLGTCAFGQGFYFEHNSINSYTSSAGKIYPQANGTFRSSYFQQGNTPLLDLYATGLIIDQFGKTVIDTVQYLPNIKDRQACTISEEFKAAFFTTDGTTVFLNSNLGTTNWNDSIGLASENRQFCIETNIDDAIFIRYIKRSQLDTTSWLAKYDANGQKLWEKTIAEDLRFKVRNFIKPTQDGGCMISTQHIDSQRFTIYKYNKNGVIDWSYTIPNGRFLNLYGLEDIGIGNGGYLVPNFDPNEGLMVTFINNLGQEVWETSLKNKTGLSLSGPQVITHCANDDFILIAPVCFEPGPPSYADWYLIRIDAQGKLIYAKMPALFPKSLQYVSQPKVIAQAIELADGSLLFNGQTDNRGFFMLKTDANGQTYPFAVQGSILRDDILNCSPDSSDAPLKYWNVKLENATSTRFANTDSLGNYYMSDIDTGAYQIFAQNPSYLYEYCQDSFVVQFPQTNNALIDTVDFQVQTLASCPLMKVDVGIGLLRRCRASAASLYYCNDGTTTADSAFIALQLDPLLEFISSDVPYIFDGTQYIFQLGDVPPQFCDRINFTIKPHCDSSQIGQNLCIEAHIYPDTLCTMPSNWSGAIIELDSKCTPDSVYFFIKNTGTGSMQNSLDFIVVDDHVITLQGNFTLGAGQVDTIAVPADGSTWRIISEQEPNFPFGNQAPSIGIEACGGFTQSMPYLNMWANFSGSPFHDIACKEVLAAYDPNDKTASPFGFMQNHSIEPNTKIDYQIRFQNTGNDTAFTVVLKDTLSAWLNPLTVRPGASSHAYNFHLSEDGILTFVFDQILLPDSTTNEPASHGFVQFSIEQMPDNAQGSIIENSASIYFDFNPPILTNTIWHTIEQIILSTKPPKQQPQSSLKAWPNPSSGFMEIAVTNGEATHRTLILRDVFGRMLLEKDFYGNTAVLEKNPVHAGVYFAEIWEAKQRLGVIQVVFIEK